MKFGHTLLVEEQAAPKELQGRFLKYKALKKMLKRRLATTARDSPRSWDQLTVETEREFLRMLRLQLKEVDKKFAADAEAVLSRYDVIGGVRSKNPLHTLLTCKLAVRNPQDSEDLLKLLNRVVWTKKYAELNATALRKIAKKRDKLCGGRVGQIFLQACFKGQFTVHAILSMPLLRELSAVEQLLSKHLASHSHLPACMKEPSPACVESAALVESTDPAENRDVKQASADDEEEQDFTCAICMDILYKPVALECGHIFCARCAISLAVGHDRSIGDPDRLLTTMAAYSAAYNNRPCPSCRSTVRGQEGESVFWQIRSMKHLDLLTKQKYPEEWQRRRDEDAQHQAELKEQRARCSSCVSSFVCC